MQFSINRYLGSRQLIKVLLILFFSCSLMHLKAQSDEDSVTLVEQLADEEDDDNNYSSSYFSKRWMYASYNDSFYLRQLPDSLLNTWKKDKSFWYADSVFDNSITRSSQDMRMPPPQQYDSSNKRRIVVEENSEYESATAAPWFHTLLLIIIIGGFVGFLLYYLSSNKGLFRKKKVIAAGEKLIEEEEDIFAINYQKEIDKAASTGNYRLAIRLMFLRLLKNMAEKHIIQYKQDRTNLDYLMQLSSTNYYNDFFSITRNYEYSWYGHFEVDETKYQLIKSQFDNFKPGVI